MRHLHSVLGVLIVYGIFHLSESSFPQQTAQFEVSFMIIAQRIYSYIKSTKSTIPDCRIVECFHFEQGSAVATGFI